MSFNNEIKIRNTKVKAYALKGLIWGASWAFRMNINWNSEFHTCHGVFVCYHWSLHKTNHHVTIGEIKLKDETSLYL